MNHDDYYKNAIDGSGEADIGPASSLSNQPSRVNSLQTTQNLAEFRGHLYGKTHVSGGRVHFGDVYNFHRTNTGTSLSEVSFSDFNKNSQSDHRYIVPRSSAAYFVGRRLQLEQLTSFLNPSSQDEQTRKTVVVYGLGGSGKTQFCLRYAESNQESYWGVFWIDATSRRTSDNGYANLGTLFGKGSTAAAGRYWLSQKNRPWLLVLDNADDPDLDMSSIMPTGTRGHVIITTRNPHLTMYATVGTLRLTGMDPEEAIDLLLNSAYPDDVASRMEMQHRSTAQQIAKHLGYLAIALHQAGATIRRKIYTLEMYLSSYLGQRRRLKSVWPSGFVEQADVIATWEIPFQRIEATKRGSYQDAVALLHMFAFLHHESIPEFIFQASWSVEDDSWRADSSLPRVIQRNASGIESAHARLREAISILYEYSIVEFDSNNNACSLHPVVHQWARSRVQDAQQIGYWLRCTAVVLASSGVYLSSERIEERTSSLLPHVDTYLQLLYNFDSQLLQTRSGASQLEQISKIYERAGRWRSSLEVLKDVIKYRMSAYGQWHNYTLRAKRSASLCHWNLFEVREAIELQLEIRWARWMSRSSPFDWRYPVKPIHTEYLIALSDLTQTLWLAGQRNWSREAGERAVRGLTQNLGKDHMHTLDAMFHLGRTYRHLGHLGEAHRMLRYVLGKRTYSLGPAHLDTLMVKNEFGMNLCSQKLRLDLAEDWIRDVLEARIRILGEEHAYTLWSVNDLAKVLSTRGRPEEAISILEDAIPAVIRTLGEKHVGMLMTKGNLARAYAQCHQWKEAEDTLEEIIPDIDPSHPDWINSMIGCTRIHIRLGKFDAAEQKCRSLLSKLEGSLERPATMIDANTPQPSVWQVLGAKLARWYVGPESTGSAETRSRVSGLLAEVCRRKGNLNEASQLKEIYPDMDERPMDYSFELI